jgi:hypothetical protein
MGLFEEQPLLLVPFIVVVVVIYDVLKSTLVRALRGRRPAADFEAERVLNR